MPLYLAKESRFVAYDCACHKTRKQRACSALEELFYQFIKEAQENSKPLAARGAASALRSAS